MTLPQLPPLPQKSPEMQQIDRMRAEAERRRSMMLNTRASMATRGITPEEPVQIDPVSLEPQVPFQEPEPEELDRHSFFGRVQSFQDVIGAAWTTGIPRITTSVFPAAAGLRSLHTPPKVKKLRDEVEQEYLESMGEPTNPWQSFRRDVMIDTEVYRRTDMPTKSFDIVPGGGINHPLGTLNEVNIGVKGAVETIGDPLNVFPVAKVTKWGLKGTALGLKKAGMAPVVEVAETSVRAAKEAMRSGKQLLPSRWRKNLEIEPSQDVDGAHIIPNATWVTANTSAKTGKMMVGETSAEEPYRFYRGEPVRTKGTDKPVTDIGPPDEQGLGDGVYLTSNRDLAINFKGSDEKLPFRGEKQEEAFLPEEFGPGDVDEYRIRIGEDGVKLNGNNVFEEVLGFGDTLADIKATKPQQYLKLQQVHTRLFNKGLLSKPFREFEEEVVDHEARDFVSPESWYRLGTMADIGTKIPPLAGDWVAYIRGEMILDEKLAGRSSDILNKELAKAEADEIAIKVFDGRSLIQWKHGKDLAAFPHHTESELMVLPGHESILRGIKTPPGIRGESGQFIREDSINTVLQAQDTAVGELNPTIKRINAFHESQNVDGRTTFSGKMLGPLVWALGVINPQLRNTVFQANEEVGKKIRRALLAYSSLKASALSSIEYSQVTLSSFKNPVPAILAGKHGVMRQLLEPDQAPGGVPSWMELSEIVDEPAEQLFEIAGVGYKNILGAKVPGVLQIDDAGRITNLVNRDGSKWVPTGEYKDVAQNQYAIFSAANEPVLDMGGTLKKAGLQHSDTYDKIPKSIIELEEAGKISKGTVARLEKLGQVVRHGDNKLSLNPQGTALVPHQLLELPAEVLKYRMLLPKSHAEYLDPTFVKQAFAIKHVQEWFYDGRKMFAEHGVDVKDIFKDKGFYLKYIHRVAIDKDGMELPDKLTTPGSVQPIDKARTNLEDLFLEASQDGVTYEKNFMLAARDFADSAYQKIRDKQLKDTLETHAYMVRREFLPVHQEAVRIAKENLDSLKEAKGWIKTLTGPSARVRLPKGRDAALAQLGERLGFTYDGDYVSAVNITKRRTQAIKKLRDESKRLEGESGAVSNLVNNLLKPGKKGEETGLQQMIRRLIPHGILSEADEKILKEASDAVALPPRALDQSHLDDVMERIQISEYFRAAYPEFSNALDDLRGLERLATKYKGTKTERIVGVPVAGKRVKAAGSVDEAGNIIEETQLRLYDPVATPSVIRKAINRAEQTPQAGVKRIRIALDPKSGRRFDPLIFYITRANADELGKGDLVRGGKKWYVWRHLPTQDKRFKTGDKEKTFLTTGLISSQFAGNPLNNGKAVSSLPAARKIVQEQISEILKTYPKTVAREGEAYQIGRRKMVSTVGQDISVSKAFQKNADKMRKALKRDLDKHKDNTKKLRILLKEVNGRRAKGADINFLKAHYPFIRKQLVAALDIDDAPVRKKRLKELNSALSKEIDNRNKIYKELDRKNKSERRKYAGSLRIKAGALNPITGKHDLEVLTGKTYKDYEGDTLIIKETSQRNLPFLRGMFFLEKDVKAIEKALTIPETQTNIGMLKGTFLRTAPVIGDLTRVLKAGFDFGAPFLQGIPLLARAPDVWVKATIRHYAVFARGGQVHTRYLQQNMEVLREMVEVGIPFSGAASDYYTAVQRGGVLPKFGKWFEETALKGSDKAAARALRKGGRTFADIGGRFENSFEAFGDYGRMEMYKALRNSAAKSGPDGLNQLAAFIRNSTGALNTGMLGVSPSQQAFERGWLFFSPRYTRASLALVADAFQGGFKGEQARQTFVQMAVGGAVVYMGICKALDQPIKLDPRPKSDGGNGAEFMTVNIAGQNIGIGSFWTSFVRLIASMGTTAADDPANFASLSTKNNPIIKWLRSRSAPMTGFTSDFINGANFLGEPLEDPVDWTKHIARQTLPFAVENAIFEEGSVFGRLGVGVPVEMSGGRTFPVDKYAQRDDEREVAARERFGKEWDSLNSLQRKELENDPNRQLGQLTRQIREEADKLRFTEPRTAEGLIDKWFHSKQEIELSWRAEIKNGVKLFNIGDLDTVTFKERHLEPANGDRRRKIGDLSEDESYVEVQKYFADNADKNDPIPVEDIIFNEYMETIVTNPEYEDPIIGFDFRAKEADERLFTDKYGHEILAYVKARFRAAREAYDWAFPALIDELYYGREKFSWYWDQVEREVMELQRNPELTGQVYETWLKLTPTDKEHMKKENRVLREFLSTMERTRMLLREQDPQLDIFMYRWGFTGTLRHKDNQWTDANGGALDFYRTHPATAFPYAVQK